MEKQGLPIRTNFCQYFSQLSWKIWDKNCPCEFKRVIYNRNVGDNFLLFPSEDHIQKFRCYFNCQHANIKFTSEIEENNFISFLNIKIGRINNSFSTSIYCKVTFSGVFTNFQSFILVSCKSNLILSLLFRAFKLCSNSQLIH